MPEKSCSFEIYMKLNLLTSSVTNLSCGVKIVIYSYVYGQCYICKKDNQFWLAYHIKFPVKHILGFDFVQGGGHSTNFSGRYVLPGFPNSGLVSG